MSYSYVPAAAFPYHGITGTRLHIKYGPTGEKGVNFELRDNHSITTLPDRRICMTVTKQRGYRVVGEKREMPPEFKSFRVKQIEFECDEIFDTELYLSGSYTEAEIKFALISAHNVMQLGLRDRSFIGSKVKLLVDSGGAQLKMGSASYVDPRHVVDVYNRIADIGMGLDVPPRPVDHGHPDVLEQLMKASAENNRIMMGEKEDHVKILNVNHGFDLNQARRWAERVSIPGVYGWAAGADNYSSDLSNIRTLLVPILEHEKLNHYHLFGFSGRSRTPIIAYIGKLVPELTSDSTSWLGNAFRRLYLQYNMEGKIEPIPCGEKCKLQMPYQLPCSCPICYRLRYYQAFSGQPSAKCVALLATHNLYAMSTYARFWNESVNNLSFEQYCKQIDYIFGPNSHIRRAVEYIECAATEGLSKADVEFRMFLGDTPTQYGMKKLFQVKVADAKKVMSALPQMGSSMEYARNYLDRLEIDPEDAEKLGREEAAITIDAMAATEEGLILEDEADHEQNS